MKMRRLMLLLLAIAGLAALPVLARRKHWPIQEIPLALLQAQPGAARSDLHASDRENEDRELSLRRVRPVSSCRRSVCGWHQPSV